MFKLIVANVRKHKFLFALIALLVVLLTFYLLVGMNAVFSVSRSLAGAVRDNMSGDAVVLPGNAPRVDLITKEGETPGLWITNWKQALAAIRALPYVEAASPRLRFWGSARSDFNMIPAMITGIDATSEPALLPRRVVDSGRWLANSNEIMFYYRHSDLLSVNAGDRVGLFVETLDGYQNYETNLLTGIFDYQDLNYYSEFALNAFVDLAFLNRLMLSPETRAGEILVRFREGGSLQRFRADLAKSFGKTLRAFGPTESSKLVSGVSLMTLFTVSFIATVLVLMVFLCSSFLVAVSIETRRKEIGVYQALGVTRFRIGLLLGGEFLLVMVLAAAVGAALGLWVMTGLSRQGIEATMLPLHLIFGRSVLHIGNHPASFIAVAGVLLLSFVGNTLNAVAKLSKLDPVEIMRDL